MHYSATEHKEEQTKEDEQIDSMDADFDQMLNNVLTTESRTGSRSESQEKKLDAKETRRQVEKVNGALFNKEEKKLVAAIKSGKVKYEDE